MNDKLDKRLKPLENYLDDIKSRNCKFGEKIPELKTLENVSNYDELYKKLIEESYYICNELMKSRDYQDRESFEANNIEKALKFSLNENDNKMYNTINPIPKQDSLFGSNPQNKKYNNLNQSGSFEANENKSLLSGQKFHSEIQENKSLIKVESSKNKYSSENKANTCVNNIFSEEKNNTNKIAHIPIDRKNKKNKVIPQEIEENKALFQKGVSQEEFSLLVNCSKQIESLLSNENPINKINAFESEISRDIKKLNDIEINQQNLIESKHSLDTKLKDLNDLFYNFQDHFIKFESMATAYQVSSKSPNIDNFVCTNCKKKNELNNNNISNIALNNITRENLNSNMKETEAFSNTFTPREINYSVKSLSDNKFLNYSSKLENIDKLKTMVQNNNRNSELKEEINPKKNETEHFSFISDNINNLFFENRFSDAINLWKKYNYQTLDNCSFERTIEMLNIALRIKEKETEKLSQLFKINENLQKEVKSKNMEIVELFAEQELTRNKLKQYEFQISNYQNLEKKVQSLINENSILYKENVKIKTLFEQEEKLRKYNNKLKHF